MSKYRPAVGDRVRVVLEDVVESVCGEEFETEHFWFKFDQTISVEKVTPPLPTTPGSVVREADSFYTLQDNGAWYGSTGIACQPRHFWHYAVIFDAGAS